MSPDVFVVEKFCKQKHDRSQFDCNIVVLNEFLKKRANQEMSKNLSVTYVLTKKDNNEIIGFYTLSNSALSQKKFVSISLKKLPRNYLIPTIRLGRMAVDKNYQGHGLGVYLLRDAIKKSVKLANEIGVFGVEIDAKNKKSLDFYSRYGFTVIDIQAKLCFMHMATLKKAFHVSCGVLV